MPRYYFNVHTVRARARGESQRLNILDLDGHGLRLTKVLKTALKSIDKVDDSKSRVRLTIEDVESQKVGGVNGINVWVMSGRYGDPFTVRNKDAKPIHNGDSTQDMARETLLRFETDRRNDQVLYASGRYGQHGVFSLFTSQLKEILAEQRPDISIDIDPVSSVATLRALLDGGTASTIEVMTPNAKGDIADKLTDSYDPEKPARFEVSHRLRIKGGVLEKARVAGALARSEDRQELARLVLGLGEADELQSDELRVPIKMRNGRTKVVVLPIYGDHIGARLGFDVAGEPQLDQSGRPKRDWLAKEAHDVLKSLRAETS